MIENFLEQNEVEALRNACHSLVESMDPEVHRGVFSAEAKDTQAHVKLQISFDCVWKVILNFYPFYKFELISILLSYFRQMIGTSWTQMIKLDFSLRLMLLMKMESCSCQNMLV